MSEPVPSAIGVPLVHHLASAAAVHQLRLPCCRRCGQVQYPLREHCAACLSDDLRWESVAPGGRLLACSTVHHSNDPSFRPRLPLTIGSVRLDCGPVVIAFVRAGLPAGTPVIVHNRLDPTGAAVLLALTGNDPLENEVLKDPNRQIAGRTVLVTGGHGGIGQALCRAFIDAGAARVYAIGRGAAARTDGPLSSEPVDITRIDEVRTLAERLAPQIDILVNNAGVNRNQRLFADEADSGARTEMEVNYFGSLNMLRAFAPAMQARGNGVVVNMLTVLAHVNLPLMATYCASKAALWSLTQAARAELAPRGVRVCGVFPAAVDTPMTAGSAQPKLAPAALAAMVIGMIAGGGEDLYPAGFAADLKQALATDDKAVERQLAARLPH